MVWFDDRLVSPVVAALVPLPPVALTSPVRVVWSPPFSVGLAVSVLPPLLPPKPPAPPCEVMDGMNVMAGLAAALLLPPARLAVWSPLRKVLPPLSPPAAVLLPLPRTAPPVALLAAVLSPPFWVSVMLGDVPVPEPEPESWRWR